MRRNRRHGRTSKAKMLGKQYLGQPYYIVTPPYQTQSAGIRCLHLLCHALNTKGRQAFLIQDPSSYGAGYRMRTNHNLLTPVLASDVVDRHRAQGKNPVTIYPEIVRGNPFNAGCVVRYVLNFPGLLSGDELFSSTELCFGYSKTLAEAAGAPSNILYIPPIDTDVFHPPEREGERKGTCFYADKYRHIFGGTPTAVTAGSVEITRLQPGSQTPEEIASLFRQSELFYTYENTSMAIEAVLCGCPAVFIPNPFLSSIIASAELGPDGYAWGTAPEDIERATSTVGQGAKVYLEKIDAFWTSLDVFIEKTQSHSVVRAAHGSFLMPPLSQFLPVAEEELVTYPSMLAATLLLPLRLLPRRVERGFGKLLSMLGLVEAGASVLRSASQQRLSHQVIYVNHNMPRQTASRAPQVGASDSYPRR